MEQGRQSVRILPERQYRHSRVDGMANRSTKSRTPLTARCTNIRMPKEFSSNGPQFPLSKALNPPWCTLAIHCPYRYTLLGSWAQEESCLSESAALHWSHEFHDFRTHSSKPTSSSAAKRRSCLCRSFVRVRADAALDESIEALWP